MNGVTPPLDQFAFMAWCLVKQSGFTLYNIGVLSVTATSIDTRKVKDVIKSTVDFKWTFAIANQVRQQNEEMQSKL